MSLVSTSSPWTNDNVSTQTRKRTSTIRKTAKLRPMNESESSTNIDEPNAYNSSGHQSTYNSSDQNYQEMQFASMDETETHNGSHTNRVNELLNKIATENDGNKLANFKPIDNTLINTRRKTVEDTNRYDTVRASIPNELLPKTLEKQPASMYSANELGGSQFSSPQFSNYDTTYPSTTLFKGNNKPYFSSSGQGTMPDIESTNGKLIEKINYMIHLLEAQQNEKTANITEEFILYIFLGVFVIFVVDSFTKTGKYVR